MQRLPHFGRLALIVCFAMAIGCSEGPRRASVGGTVSVAGKPLERGVITFIPVEGSKGPGTGGAISDGEYSLDGGAGAVVGKCRVEIRGFRKTGRKVNSPVGPPIDEEVQVVPTEFNDKSTLVRDIGRGDNEINFELPGIQEKKK